MADPIFGTPDDDNLSYVTANDPLSIYGLGGNDTIGGGSNSDLLDGGIGNDVLIGASGHDHLVGGADNDETSGGPGNDWHEGGNGDDTLYDAAGADMLDGGAGNDSLTAGEEDDTLYAGTGHDYLSGGNGNDRLFADGSFADGTDTLSGGDGNDVYILSGANFTILQPDAGLDRLEISVTMSIAGFGDLEDLTLTGTAAINGTGNGLANTINGNNAANVLDGGGGNDLIRGYGGNDALIGGLGGGVEYLYGGTGDDTYVVMDLDDAPVEFGGEGADTVQSSIRWVLGNNLENLVLTGTASVNGFGNGIANTLTGNSGANYLDGGAELDTLAGGAGNDSYALASSTLINGGYTWDTVIEGAGAGTDTVYASADVGRYTYQLTANVENLVATGVSAFRLWGNELNNSLTGNDAANEMAGFDGNDVLDGNAGLDTLTGGLGGDIYILEDLTFIDEFTGYVYDTVVEAAGGGNDTVFVTNLGNDFYYLDANVEGCGVFGEYGLTVIGNDLNNGFVGNDAYNRFEGLGGNDLLSGYGGLDELIGGDGDDHYFLDDATLVNGGYVWDTVSEAGSTGIDTVSASADVGRYTYQLGANVENLVATGVSIFRLWGNELDNRLTGNAAANEMAGFDGNDTLQGGAGADTLEGGLGDDVFYVDTNADRVVENAGEGYDRVYASAFFSLSQVAEVEYLATANAAGTAGTDLTGSNTANTIVGDAGSNTLTGRGGADALYGGAGSDFASYAGAAVAVIASLANPTINTGDAAGDTYTSIENLIGSNFNDALNGDNGINDIRGGVGGDTLKGYAGNDILYGQDGDDTLIGGVGADDLSGSAGFDTASYAGATARVIVSLANSSINAGDAAGDSYLSIENLTGSSFNDTLNGDNSANVVNGGAGNDFIKGYGGNDTLTGGTGEDAFIFNTALAAATNVDAITDFSVADDTIQLDDAIFAAIAATGALLSGYFRANATGTAQDSNDHIVYETDTGKLFYDANGNGAGAAVQFALLTGNPTITAADFQVV